MRKAIKFFDRLEDKVRGHLSRLPILYAIIGGMTIVVFWRGVWHLADVLEALGGWWAVFFSPDISLIISIIVLLTTGLFVSFFIGDRIILSGLKHEKKVEEKTEAEVREEETMLVHLNTKFEHIAKELEEIKSILKK